MAEQAPFYLFTAFVFAYGTDVLHLKRDFLLMAVLAAAMISFVSIPLFGHLSDRFGRKRVYMLGAALTGVYGFAYFALLDTRVPGLVVLAIMLSLVTHDMMYGPQAALIAESFPGRLRYSGASLGYQLSSLIAGGPAPLIAFSLVARYRSATPIAMFILGCAIITLLATAMLKDSTNKDISDD
jgi:MFS family permease